MPAITDRLNKLIKSLSSEAITEVAYQSFVSHTPIRTGNARSKTKKGTNRIDANYPYATNLENNSSPQTNGKGISEPTIEDVRAYIAKTTGTLIKG